jgi:triosephosphate isomerase
VESVRKILIVGNWKMQDLDMIRDKTAAAFRNEITPILCVGETGPEREEGETKQVLHDQLMSALSNLTAGEVGQMVIAYEPVWAISDGSNFKEHLVAKPDQVAEAVKYIRNYVRDVYSERAAKELRVLYGGSTIPEVVSGFLDVPGVDGFLVGGASLNYHLFSQIVNNARHWQRQSEEG